MSIRNYYKGECTEKIFIVITAYNFESACNQMENMKKKYSHIKDEYIEILVKINE